MRYTLEIKPFGRAAWRRLSVSAKAPFSRFEVECHRHQWAADNQKNPSCLDMRVLQNGIPFAVFPSDASINAGGEV